MSVRVVARIRPLLKLELEKDTIVTAESSGKEPGSPTVIRIPNPKNEAESYTFQFNSVYTQEATQQDLFDHEVSPTVKHLFNGFDTTIFAYGVTGTGKTHTMRGGKKLADRGVIPRLLSAIYRRARKVEKDTEGKTQVEVAMSYYEIYNDKVYDLFEPPERRTPSGLPIRDNNGKTVVVGLTERPCTTLKEFEQLYDEANINRSTSATKLNAHSSRSHAILCVKLTQTTETTVRISRASAIDLAGSEDNRRTENNRERLVESSAINKSLFVLAQCVEAISKKQSRIPYRESKMTRILSLGQNNGFTLMILNLAPVRSYHLDTLSSLNFANRTKKIEVAEIENEPIYRVQTKPAAVAPITGSHINRQPLRPISATHNSSSLHDNNRLAANKAEKPAKAFSVYSDNNNKQTAKSGIRPPVATSNQSVRRSELVASHKRAADSTSTLAHRAPKSIRPNYASARPPAAAEPAMSAATIEALIESKLAEKLAERALDAKTAAPAALPPDLQARLDALEQRIDAREDETGRSEGLHFLLMAKQHQARGEDGSALRMFLLARPYFPGNERLDRKIESLQRKMEAKRAGQDVTKAADEEELEEEGPVPPVRRQLKKKSRRAVAEDEDEESEYEAPANGEDEEEDDDDVFKPRTTSKPKTSKPAMKPHLRTPSKLPVLRDPSAVPSSSPSKIPQHTPRTRQLLDIVNTRDVTRIRSLKGVGAKKAEAIVDALLEMDAAEGGGPGAVVRDLAVLGSFKGVGARTVEGMRVGLGSVVGAPAAGPDIGLAI